MALRGKVIVVASLALILLSCTFLYWPGLAGTFLLDDFPNLGRLSLLNTDAPAGEFWRSIWMGQSGILRRPIAMLSFALQHPAWPNNPSAFKAVNLILHLACGALVFWLATLLTRIRGENASIALGTALIASFFWLINPIHVSTTLYVIQRMTQLACFFVLLATCLYLHGRRLAGVPAVSRSGLAIMALSVTFGTLLASLSKENGALLPGLILVLEFTLLARQPKPEGWRLFSAVFLWLPVCALVLLLAWQFPQIVSTYDYRPFSLTERLLTEPRVVLDYVGKIFLPRPNAYGLFFDDFPISNSILKPLTTAVSLFAIVLSAWSSLVLRKKTPWWAFSVLWFLIAHILESTYLPLELYFEHRNYLPSVSLAIGVGALVVAAWRRASARHVRASLAGATAIALAGYAFVTAKEVELWSNPVKQIAVWFKAHPQSLRGQIVWGWLLASSGKEEIAEEVYREANARHSGDPFFMIKGLALHCSSDKSRWPSENDLFTQLHAARFSKTVLLSLEEVVDKVESGQCQGVVTGIWVQALDILIEKPEYAPSRYLLWFYRARLLAYDNQIDKALQSIDKSLALNSTLAYYTYPIYWLVEEKRTKEAVAYLARARTAQKSQTIDGILYKPVLDEWEAKIRRELNSIKDVE